VRRPFANRRESARQVAAEPTHPQLYVVVPGNVGAADTLRRILASVGLGEPALAAGRTG
jgi:hypothetical protein